MTFAYDPFVAPLREVEIEDDITSFEILPYETLKDASGKNRPTAIGRRPCSFPVVVLKGAE